MSLSGRLRGLLAGQREWQLLLRFGFVGLLNTAFGYAVFALLVLAGSGPFVALTVATVAGVAFNFQTSRRLVFRSRGRTLRFIALYVAVLLLNTGALRALRDSGLSNLEAQAILALPVACLSFIGQKSLVFGLSRRAGAT